MHQSPSLAYEQAPPLRVSQWFNAPRPLTLDSLRGRAVALHAFQMLCPGCVSHGLPQAGRLHQLSLRISWRSWACTPTRKEGASR